MDDEVKWLAGAVMTMVGMIGGLITRDRQVMAKIEDGDKSVMAKVDNLQQQQSTMQLNYVRRDDLKEHLQSIEKMIALSRDEQQALTRRFDHLITSINSQKRGE